MTRIGTSHFVSRAAAERYYRDYGYSDVAEAVTRKLAEGEIHIGKPMTCEPDERITLDAREGRYVIERDE